MDDLVIRVSGLGKQYRIPERKACYSTLRDAVAAAAVAPAHRLWSVLRGRAPTVGSQTRSIWALKDVSFDVKRGEVLGIIGRNGSGKSTLLKMLSRITAPTQGNARIRGRIGSLLEVGTGFHFELSGRDNIFMNGAMLGMRREEINRKFDAIVDFSQIGDFIDTPVKHYSSGMYMRLAFSVAAHLESEILLVDEVLAVGDFDFQKKCLEKMRELTRTGRTVLFVSHSISSIESLCHRAMLLVGGKMEAIGPVNEVVQRYMPREQVRGEGQATWVDPQSAPGNDSVSLHSVSVLTDDGVSRSQFNIAEPVTIRIVYWNHEPGAGYRVSIRLRDQNGAWVLSARNEHAAEGHADPWVHRPYPTGLFESSCRIPGNLLNNHTYKISLDISPSGQGSKLVGLHQDDVLSFRIVDPHLDSDEAAKHFLGPIRPRLSWQTDRKDAA
jgi:lipopolysaccharide transport system ATP-binding protein